MINDNALINEIAGVATLAICVMTFITFMITTGALEPGFWESDLQGASIIGCDGQWGEDFVVVYTDGTTESVKGIYNNYWATMSIRDDNSKPIVTIQYCINAMIPVSDVFNTREYWCDVSIVQDGVEFYQTSYTTTDSINVEANEWTRIVTVVLDIESVAEGLNDGLFTVSFDNIGTIEDVAVPDGRSIDIVVDDGIVRFLI